MIRLSLIQPTKVQALEQQNRLAAAAAEDGILLGFSYFLAH